MSLNLPRIQFRQLSELNPQLLRTLSLKAEQENPEVDLEKRHTMLWLLQERSYYQEKRVERLLPRFRDPSETNIKPLQTNQAEPWRRRKKS